MPHLKKGGDGHLLKNSGGHLVVDCGSAGVCNECSPAIPDTLYVTFSGQARSFAIWEGKNEVPWHYGCVWRLTQEVDAGTAYLVIIYRAGQWQVECTGDWQWDYYYCKQTWLGDSAACGHEGAYTLDLCRDDSGDGRAGCVDDESCEDSAGATCVVSET